MGQNRRSIGDNIDRRGVSLRGHDPALCRGPRTDLPQFD